MIKTLSKAQKVEREKFRIPRSVQDAIPIHRIYTDGIFQVGNQYSKTWSFTDINYAIASKEDKTSMFLDYSELLNALDSGASAKITIYNRRINKAEFERSVLLPDRDDGLDEYRHEFNQMLTAQVTGTSNSIVRERYLTVSVVKRNADEARSYFARVGTDLVTHLAQLSSAATELTLNERLHIFRDFFKAGEQVAAEFNIHEHAKRGQHFKDWFCPDSMEFAADHFKLDARYGRVLYLQDYASYIKDSFVSELCDLDRDLMLSIDILPVPTDEAARQLQSTLLGVETNVANWQRRQNANNNFTATIPYDMELQRKETKEMLDDLTTRDQRMMFGLVTLVHLADSKEQLDSDTETLYSTARKHLCQLSTLRWQQKDGLDTVLPYGLRRIQALRTLTTESTAVLIPFRAQEIMEPNGLYYGQNAVSKNMIVADRRLLLNGNSFRLGVSGSGKSMSAKEEIVQIALSTEDDILILDPESEFGYLTEALGGEVIRISATSDTHINALDMDRAYGDERNPIVSKSEFVLSLFEQLIGDGMVTAKEKSILGRCTEQVYLPYIRNGYKGTPPTLQDFYRLLQMQPESEAQGLALASELFITGTLNTFAQRTNVDTNARIIDYDIRELGEQLMPLGMLVTLDAIYNRVIRNWKSGKTTWIFCDEFYVLFRYEYSANFFYKLWKRIRKYNGLITGLLVHVIGGVAHDLPDTLGSDFKFYRVGRIIVVAFGSLQFFNEIAAKREFFGRFHQAIRIGVEHIGFLGGVAAGRINHRDAGLVALVIDFVQCKSSASNLDRLAGFGISLDKLQITFQFFIQHVIGHVVVGGGGDAAGRNRKTALRAVLADRYDKGITLENVLGDRSLDNKVLPIRKSLNADDTFLVCIQFCQPVLCILISWNPAIAFAVGVVTICGQGGIVGFYRGGVALIHIGNSLPLGSEIVLERQIIVVVFAVNVQNTLCIVAAIRVLGELRFLAQLGNAIDGKARTLQLQRRGGLTGGRNQLIQREAGFEDFILAFLLRVDMVTQNVEELLRSDTARLMLANSEFLVLLNQSATDREELAKLLNISDTQLGYITNVPAGCGLIRCAGSIVPFTNSFPKNTRLYQLMTTKPDEALR